MIGDKITSGPIEVTGPEALGLGELAGRLAKLHGEEITAQALTKEELAAHLKAKNFPEPAVNSLVKIVDWLVNGNFSPATDVVERVAGVKPTPVDEFLKQFASQNQTAAFMPGAGKAS